MSDEKNKGYFSLSEALDEVRHDSFGAKETAVAGLKLFGKGIFNAARFAVKEVIPAAVEQTAKHNARTSKDLLKRDDLTEEQRDRLEQVRDKSQQYVDAQDQKRRDKEALEAERSREEVEPESEQSITPNLNAASMQPASQVQTPTPELSATEAFKSAKSSNSRASDSALPAQQGRRSVPTHPTKIVDAALACAASISRQQEHNDSASKDTANSASISDQPPELAKYLQLLKGIHERVYVGPHIPENKLDNARNGRPVYCRSSTPLLLVDDTVMGGGKDGLLVTDEHISFKAAFSDSHNFAVKFSRALAVPDGFKFHVVPSAVIDVLLGQLRAFFADRLQWHERAAENGKCDSQFFLSTQYETADDRGPYWLIRAAQAGHATAQHNLGMQIKGFDSRLAMHWFGLAAQQGHELARTRLTDLRRTASSPTEAEMPKGTIRLIDLMSAQTVRELEQVIDTSHAAIRRAMQRISEEEQRPS